MIYSAPSAIEVITKHPAATAITKRPDYRAKRFHYLMGVRPAAVVNKKHHFVL